MGAVVAVPDYVGYGHSSHHKHPYQHKENTAQSTYDFLLASQEYLKRKRIETNGDLFLTGYSQGGHATMALHQKIEKENQLRVTHSISGAGAYNVTAFSREILTKDQDLPFMGTYVWLRSL
jgi:dienelactone hydrolase